MALRIFAAALLATSALAKTDIAGCTYFDDVVKPAHGSPYATRTWYVPDTGELCEILDCGGGRAPPKTNVPGCGNYKGTDTYKPRFIDPKTLGQQSPATTARAETTTTSEEEVAPEETGSGAETGSVESTLATLTTSGSAVETETEVPTMTAAPSHSESEAVSRGGQETSSASKGTETTTAKETVPTGAAAIDGAPLGALVIGLAACIAML
nr:hypothetical protein [Sesquicillium sp.]